MCAEAVPGSAPAHGGMMKCAISLFRDMRFSAANQTRTNFFEKNVRIELAFSGMSARLNNMPDAGVAQW